MPEMRVTADQYQRLQILLNSVQLSGVANAMLVAEMGALLHQIGTQAIKPEPAADDDQKVLPFNKG